MLMILCWALFRGKSISRILFFAGMQSGNHLSMRLTRTFKPERTTERTALSCSWQGLPLKPIARRDRVLLPHVFTLTTGNGGGYFLRHFP